MTSDTNQRHESDAKYQRNKTINKCSSVIITMRLKEVENKISLAIKMVEDFFELIKKLEEIHI